MLLITLHLLARANETVLKLEVLPPEYDGGVTVARYIKEWRLESSPVWNREPKLPAISEYTFRGMEPGTYFFRVRAVNNNGTGTPGEVKEVTLEIGRIVKCKVRCGDGLEGNPVQSVLQKVEEFDFMQFQRVSYSPVPYRFKA